MFNPKPNPDATRLDKVIDDLLREMAGPSGDSSEYAAMVDQLVKLQTLKTESGPTRVSPDVKATIAANLAGILAIVGYEQAHIVTSKALGFVKKLV